MQDITYILSWWPLQNDCRVCTSAAWNLLSLVSKQVHFKLLHTKHDPAMNVSWGVNLMQQSIPDWRSVFDGHLHVMSQGAGTSCKLSFASCAAALGWAIRQIFLVSAGMPKRALHWCSMEYWWRNCCCISCNKQIALQIYSAELYRWGFNEHAFHRRIKVWPWLAWWVMACVLYTELT